jgi:alpha-L-fucosidase
MFNLNLVHNTMKYLFIACFLTSFFFNTVNAQETERWDKEVSAKPNSNQQWFKDAKFGMFIHWGLFAEAGGAWNGKNYYGISEWMMNRGKISATDYAALAKKFNPTQFNAKEWAQLAKDAGMKYMVITAKHHEGFAMFDSKISDFNIVKATPYRKDPMKPLAQAVREAGLKFGFYYSQFLDWHEPNGGGNKWDFDETKKDYQAYYHTKSIPQIKELLSNYGPLGLIWFDMPGGLSKEETQSLINDVRKIQPGCLISSRVGNGLGDFKDYGDGEIPATISTTGAWEALFTHNDSWGYSKFDYNFKSPKEIVRLLTTVSSKGGNLILNVGPDSSGKMPAYSVKYLRRVGKWLKANGEAIYGTTAGFINPQPWGLTTAKPHKLYLHVFERPKNGFIFVPGLHQIKKAYLLANKQPLAFIKSTGGISIKLPYLTDDYNTVIAVNLIDKAPALDLSAPVTISNQYSTNALDAINAHPFGKTQIKSITYSHYFGDWKHVPCLIAMATPQDGAVFHVNITEPGDYKVTLEYACTPGQAKQEGVMKLNGKEYQFETLPTSDYESHKPLLFIKQTIAITTIKEAGPYQLSVQPIQNCAELFKLKTIWLEPTN